MHAPVSSIVYRTLRGMERYRPLSELSYDPIKSISTIDDEITIGVYDNQGDGNDSIIITNIGIYVVSDGHQKHIRYNQISQVNGPSTKQDTSIKILVSSGLVLYLHINGMTKGFSDVFEFTRFLMRAAEISRTMHEM